MDKNKDKILGLPELVSIKAAKNLGIEHWQTLSPRSAYDY